MSSAQEKFDTGVPSPSFLAAWLVPEPSKESQDRIDTAKAEVAAVLGDLYDAVNRLLKIREALQAPPRSEENLDLSSESDRQRFKPGQSKVEGTDTSVEAYLRDELELVAIDKDCEPSGLLPTLDPIKKILELNHFFVREMVANGLELMKPDVYRAIAEAAAKGEWLKGVDLT